MCILWKFSFPIYFKTKTNFMETVKSQSISDKEHSIDNDSHKKSFNSLKINFCYSSVKHILIQWNVWNCNKALLLLIKEKTKNKWQGHCSLYGLVRINNNLILLEHVKGKTIVVSSLFPSNCSPLSNISYNLVCLET